jgi:hypothetical protein
VLNAAGMHIKLIAVDRKCHSNSIVTLLSSHQLRSSLVHSVALKSVWLEGNAVYIK